MLAVLAGCGGESEPSQPASQEGAGKPTLAVALPASDELALVDPEVGIVARVPVGASPWGVAVADSTAYVSTARHLAIVDLARRRVAARVRYRTTVGKPEVGESRAGGMGIAVAPDGDRIYVGVHPQGGGAGRLELIDAARRKVVDAVPIGQRPFDVLVSRDGGTVYTIDHDSYGVSVVNTRTLAARAIAVAPLGRGTFAKLHYGALDDSGRLLLPINGEVLVTLDTTSGAMGTRPLRSRVHQAGVVRAGDRLLTVGAEALEGDRGPNLSVFDLTTGRERVIELDRPHEDIVASRDGRVAYLTGGFLRGGWKGITTVDLSDGSTSELELPEEPLGIALIGG
ncbi:MAG: YncE family protein [Solirubrobacteraceae bacterium]